MSHERYIARRQGVNLDRVDLGLRGVTLLQPEELSAAQEEFDGEDWSSEWLVVGFDEVCGDPIFTDLSVEHLPIFWAAHDVGDTWEPVQIADSLDGFVAALAQIASVSAGREGPVGLEANPVPEDERKQILARIRAENPHSDDKFWASWFDVYDE